MTNTTFVMPPCARNLSSKNSMFAIIQCQIPRLKLPLATAGSHDWAKVDVHRDITDVNGFAVAQRTANI